MAQDRFHIFSVREISRAIKDVLEGGFPFIWVRGQISNISTSAAGHIYFSLKDKESLLQCMWFCNSQTLFETDNNKELINPLTGEVIIAQPKLEDGQEVLCAGALNVYAPNGTYKLKVEVLQEQGIGLLHLDFLILKDKLQKIGYFDDNLKKDIPNYPTKIAIITSLQTAALQDFLRISNTRGPASVLRIYPASVQGDKAPNELCNSLEQIKKDDWAQIAVIIRGGGSIEDLSAFNDERLAHAIYKCKIPIITGIGHETDTSIADLVADVRCATPSHVAQYIFKENFELMHNIDMFSTRIVEKIWLIYNKYLSYLVNLNRGLRYFSPLYILGIREEKFSGKNELLLEKWNSFFLSKEYKYFRLHEKLLNFTAKDITERQEQQLTLLTRRLVQILLEKLNKNIANLGIIHEQLLANDKKRILKSGFALLVDSKGKVIKSAQELSEEAIVEVIMHDGKIGLKVLWTKQSKEL